MAKYRKKPVVIEAWELTNSMNCRNAICEIANSSHVCPGPNGGINIKTLEGRMYAATGDYIIRGVNGEYYPCKPDIFKKTYEAVEE